MQVCKQVRYSGRVQGVGFRCTTQTLARRHPVAGFVRNLPNGEVELVVEGNSASVEAFLDDVADHFAENVDDCRITDRLPTGLNDFTIRH